MSDTPTREPLEQRVAVVLKRMPNHITLKGYDPTADIAAKIIAVCREHIAAEIERHIRPVSSAGTTATAAQIARRGALVDAALIAKGDS